MLLDRPRRFALSAGFFVLALLNGWLLAGVLPLGQAADEAAHAVRVDALSRGRGLGHREGTAGGFTTQPTLADVAFKTFPRHPQTRAERDAAEAVGWDAPRRFIELGTIATYFPAVYLPAAAAVLAARRLHATPAQAFMAGRRANVLTFALAGAAALALARRGRALIAAVLLLPMSLGLAASLSGDAMMIAMAALAAACLTRCGHWEWWAAAALLTLLGLTKPPYAPLLLALAAGRPALPVRLGVVALSAALMLGWAAYNQAAVMGTTGWPPYAAGPLWPGPPRQFATTDPAAQLQVLLADPAQATALVVRTLGQETQIWPNLIGTLGWLNITLPDWLYALWTGALALASLGLLTERGPGPASALAGLLGIALGAWAIMLAQYLGWTEVGAAVIAGVQGRYFLPLLPFLAVAVLCVRPLRLPGLDAVPIAAGFVSAATVPVVVALASFVR